MGSTRPADKQAPGRGKAGTPSKEGRDTVTPTTETIEPLAVLRWVKEADTLLGQASVLTKDLTIADALKKARKELGPAVRRARLILDDEQLKVAKQQSLFLEGAER